MILIVMLCEISSNSNIKIQESLWRIPNSVSDIKNISQYLNGDTYNELLELYKGYFINNDAIKLFLQNGLLNPHIIFIKPEVSVAITLIPISTAPLFSRVHEENIVILTKSMLLQNIVCF